MGNIRNQMKYPVCEGLCTIITKTLGNIAFKLDVIFTI